MYEENAPDVMHESVFWFCWKEFLCENCAEETRGPTRGNEEVLGSPIQSGDIVEDSHETPTDDLDLEENQGIFSEKESWKVKTRMSFVLSIVP